MNKQISLALAYLLACIFPESDWINWLLCLWCFKHVCCPLLDDLNNVNSQDTIEACFTCLYFFVTFSFVSRYKCDK